VKPEHILAGLAAFAAFALPSAAKANQIEAVPTGWRLENYIDTHRVVLWHVSAPECANGYLAGSLSQDDSNRFWSLVTTAKAAGSRVGIYYNETGGVCEIVSFYAP
jgi:hypothetical protein